MKAVLLDKVESVVLTDIPVPEIGPEEVLVKVRATGVCGSDLHAFIGQHLFRKPPVILGHEMAGQVYSTGKEVTGLKTGDRVVVNPTISCGRCKYCREGNENLCNHRIAPGTNGWIGTFSEYFPIPQDKVYRIPDNIPYERAALTEPLANCVHVMSMPSGAERKSVAIIGCGTMGLLCLVLAKLQGYETIVGSDPAPFNRQTAEKLGATLTVDPLRQDIVSIVEEATGGNGVDVCVVAAGAPGILDQASDITKKGGEIILVAMMTEATPIHSTNLLTRQQSLKGSMLYNTADFEEALRIVCSEEDLSPFLTHSMPLSDAQKALMLLRDRNEDVIKVTLTVD